MPRPHVAPTPTDLPAAVRVDEPACPLCGSREVARRGPREGPFGAIRCRCGMWYLSPRLAEDAMAATYRDETYFEGEGPGYSSYLAQEATLRRTFRHLLAALSRRGMTGGRLLEIGCAYGFFLEEAASAFAERVGTDLSPEVAERARGRADRVLAGGLEALGPDERFDLVASIHVIEHVYDPVAFVSRVREHLSPGGWLVLATPDMGGFWRHLLGRRWPFYKMPEHVTYFDRATLARLLVAGGFEDVRPIPYASYFSLGLVAEKLGLTPDAALPGGLQRVWLRLPATTVAFTGRAP